MINQSRNMLRRGDIAYIAFDACLVYNLINEIGGHARLYLPRSNV